MATIHYKDKWRLWSWLLMGMERQITGYGTMTTESSTSITANHPDTKGRLHERHLNLSDTYDHFPSGSTSF